MAESHPQIGAPQSPRPPVGSQPSHSISTRIILFVFLSTFLTALVVSWISIQSIHGHLRRQIEAGFPAILERRVARLDAWLEGTRAALETRAREEKLASAHGRSGRARRSAGKRLEKLLAASPRFRGLALLDADQQLVARAGDVDDAVLGQGKDDAGRGGRPLRSVRSSTLGVVMVARVPIGESGAELLGVLRTGQLREYLRVEEYEGPGRILLLDHTGAPMLAAPGDVGENARAPVRISRLLRAGVGHVVEYTDADGQRMLGSVQSLGTLDWLVLVAAPFDRVFAPVLSVVSRIFLSDLAIILLFSLLAYKITGAIMQPIAALSEGATRISQGDIEHEIPTPRSDDEIGLLTRTFNDMMRKLRNNQREIEFDRKQLTEQNEELQRANEVLAQLSITDGLTKLHNHRYFQDHLTREIKRLSRTGEPLSMILVDLDDFKLLNDRFGHAAGDEVLARIATLMNDSVRESDLLARYGGEEFVILAPGTSLAGAVALAEKVRMTVENASQIIDDSMRPVRVTISLGAAEYRGERKQFFQAADRALYDAKAEGKNCVIAAEDAAPA